MYDTDIAIIGAGPVGLALANLLARNTGHRITLIDSREPTIHVNDARRLALAHGSYLTLQQAQAWGSAIQTHATAIKHIHVSQAGHFGRTLLHHHAYQLPALGYVVPYGAVLHDLYHALPAHVTRKLGHAVTQLDCPISPRLHLANGESLQAKLVVQAEGGLFTEQAHKPWRRDYGQMALVGTVQVERFQAGWAFERFTSHGPLALLPQAQHYALVWCDTHEACHTRQNAKTADCLAALQQAFGDQLGRFSQLQLHGCYTLGLNAQKNLVNQQIITIGNAAQTLHPVAGQGFNLGLRDAYTLANILTQAKSLRHLDISPLLQQFNAARQRDRFITIGATDLLPQLFSLSLPGVSLIRGLGLTALDLFPPFQKILAKHMLFGQR